MREDFPPNRLIVTQANALARSAQQMSLQEKRLLLLAISLVRHQDKEFKVCHIPVRDLSYYLGIEHNDQFYRELPMITADLLSRVLHIDYENGTWEQFQWVSEAKYITAREHIAGYAVLKIKLNDHLKPLLLALEAHFGSIPFEQLATLPSFYSIRILEILWHESFGGQKTEVYLELEELKKSLGLIEMKRKIREEKYPNFKDFRKRVLDKAKRDCDEKGMLSFDYSVKIVGRKVVGIFFQLSKNLADVGPMLEPMGTPEFRDDEALIKPTPKHPELSRNYYEAGYQGDVEQIVALMGEETAEMLLKSAYERQKQSLGTKSEIKNLGGFIQYLIDAGQWQVTSMQVEQKKLADKEASIVAEMNKLSKTLEKDYDVARQGFRGQVWQKLTKAQQEDVHHHMNKHGHKFVLGMLGEKDWREDNVFYMLERARALEHRGHLTYPPELNTFENFTRSEAKKHGYNLEAIERLLRGLAKAKLNTF